MLAKPKNRRKLETDKKTDHLFDYFVNPDKFNDQLRGEWDNDDKEHLENYMSKNPTRKLDSHVTETRSIAKSVAKNNSSVSSSSVEVELPSHHTTENGDSDGEDSLSISSVSENVNSPYKQKIPGKTETKPKTEVRPKTETRPKTEGRPKTEVKPILPTETPEERRARAREAHCTIEDLKRKGVFFTKNYTSTDDPDEMEAEIAMQRERKNKQVQVKFYKQILLGIVSGIEFLNTKYDPFNVQLTDWSKQIATDQDDYTEVLEELYEKYKDKGGKMAPEIRLLFMIIMSGVTFHLSKTIFNDNTVGDMVRNNPNIIGELLKNFTSRGNPQAAVPIDNVPSKTNEMLSKIRDANRESHQNPKTTAPPKRIDHTSPASTEKINQSEMSSVRPTERPTDSRLKQERDALAEKSRSYEMQLRKQDEMYRAQLEQTRNQNLRDQPQTNFVPVNRVLSGKTENRSIFESDKPRSKNNENSAELFDLIDSLENSITSDISDMKSTTNNKKSKSINRSLGNKSVNNKDNNSQSDNLSTLSRGKKKSLVL